MCGGGSGAILEALPIPLGSASTLFSPPTFAGPGGMPLIGRFPAPASPAIRANEAVGADKRMNNAKAIPAVLVDMRKLHDLGVCVTDFDVVHPAVGAIKLNFRIYTLDEFLAPRASEIRLGLRRPHRPRCGSSIAGVALDH